MKIVKKTILILCLLIFICSLCFNYFIFGTSLGKFMNEETRINKNSDLFTYLSPLSFNPKFLKEDSLIQNDSLFQLMDLTRNQLVDIADELISTSGGVNVDGQYLNPYGIEYVQIYFYKENNFRSHSISFFNETIEYYINRSKVLGFESSVSRSFENLDKSIERDLIFKNLTLAESILFIESICSKILIDKYQYLLTKQSENINLSE